MELQTEDFHPRESGRPNNPIEKIRRPTDRCFIFVFIPILLMWLAISIYEFCVDRIYLKDTDSKRAASKAHVNGPVLGFSWVLPASVFLSLAGVFICLFLYEKLTKFFIYLFCILYVLGFLGYWSNLILLKRPKTKAITDYISLNIGLMLSWLGILPFLLYMIISIISFFKVDKSVICEIMKSSCRFILRSPLLFIFNALLFIPVFTVISLILNVYFINKFDVNKSNLIFNDVSCVIATIGGVIFIQLLSNFSLMVISEYTINHFWTKGEKMPIGKSAVKILRNHSGTLIFASTIFVSTVCSIIRAFKHKPSWRIKENYFTYFVTKVSLAIMMPEIALIFTSIYGTGFSKSYQKTFDTVLRRCSVHLAMILVAHVAVLVLILFSFLPLYIIVYFMLTSSRHGVDESIENSSFLYGWLYVCSASAILLFSTMKAQLINKIIILNEEHENSEEKTRMFSHL